MFWDLMTVVTFIGTWVYIASLYKVIQDLRKDVDNVMTFNRISRYHALNEEVIRSKENER